MELWWSFGGSGFIGADAMVRGHFSILCSDSYVVNFVSYLVVVADKSSRVVVDLEEAPSRSIARVDTQSGDASTNIYCGSHRYEDPNS